MIVSNYMRQVFPIFALAVLLASPAALVAAEDGATPASLKLRAGAATSNLTPPLGTRVVGSFPVQVLRIRDIAIGTSPCETFAEIGLEFKQRSPLPHSFMVSLVHGYIGYLPTPRHFELGGYETWPGTNYLEPQASVKLLDALIGMTAELAPQGGLQSLLGEPKFEMQRLFEGERFPNVVVTRDGTVLATWGSRRVRVRRSEDGGTTWPVKRLVNEDLSAYSSLAAGRPGTASEGWIYLQFEHGKDGQQYAGGQLARFHLAWLLAGEATGDGQVPDWVSAVNKAGDP